MGSTLLEVNGLEALAYVIELADGLRVRLALDDWQRMNLGTGQRIPVKLPGAADLWLFVTNVIELPPVVWVVMAKRVKPRQVTLEGMA